jgi:molybdate transport system substrate-binding protein
MLLTRSCASLVVAIAALVMPAPARAQDVTVAAAADLQAALPELVKRFEQQTGRKVRLTFGSSGNFFAQIQNGAPFDVFLSADIEYPRRLQDAGLTEPGTLTPYATGRIVLWTRRDSGIDVRQGLRALLTPAVRRIAIANPAHAPYGRAAVAALRNEGVYEAVRERFVLGENISQAAQFAQSGNADVGILALSLAVGPALKASGTYMEIPASLHPPIAQGAVVLKSTRDRTAAKQFLAFLARPASVQYLETSGFDVPAR